MKATLKKLVIKNFKGTQNATYEFEDKTIIAGMNGTGKTTIAEAIEWGIRTTRTKDDLKYKPYDKNKNPIKNLMIEIELHYDIDGASLVLHKIMEEKWTKRRNVGEEELKHKMSYFVNNEPVSHTEYKKHVETHFGSYYVILSNPRVFALMEVEDRRKMLLALVDEGSDMDYAKMFGSQEIIDILETGRSLEGEKTVLAGKIKKLKEKKAGIPDRIDENVLNMPDYVEETSIKEEIQKLESELKSIEESENDIRKKYKKEKEEYQRKVDEISMLRTQIYNCEKKIKEAAELKNKEDNKEVKEKKRVLTQEMEELNQQEKDAREKAFKVKNKFGEIHLELSELRSEYKMIKEEKFEISEGSLKCPTCHREYEDAETRIEEYLEAFNKSRAERLEANVRKGKENSELKDKLTAEYEKYLAVDNSKRISEIKKELSELKEVPLEYNTASSEIEGKQAKIKALEEECQEKMSQPEIDNQERKKEIRRKISDLEKSFSGNEVRKTLEAKNNAYQKELIQVSQDMNELDNKLYAITEFVKNKMLNLEKSINEKFELVSFKLWDYYQNGNDLPVCDIYVGGVPYSTLNTAGQINAGIDIINVLSEHKDMHYPIIVDNRESVTDLIDSESQIISLVVDRRYMSVTKI